MPFASLPLIAVLFACPPLLLSTALIHRLPIESTGSLRTRLLHSGQWRSIVERTRHDLAVGPDKQLEYYRGFYAANISLGIPPQNFTVAFDTACPYFWLIDPICRSKACTGKAMKSKCQTEVLHRKKGFNVSLSSTVTGGGNHSFGSTCQEGFSTTKGRLYKDRLEIGPLHFDSQQFVLAEHVAESWADHPIDGVLGLSWPSLEERGQRPPLMNMLDQLDEPVFTVWVDWRRPVELGGSGGVLTLGGRDYEHCDSVWKDVVLGSRSNWQFPIQRFKVGRFRSFRTQYAIADTGCALIGGPHPQVNMIVEATGAVFSQEDDLFTVPCDQIPILPAFVLTINGTDFSIPADEYVLDLDLSDGKCALGVFGMYSNGFSADWVLGDIFFDTYCAAFNYGNGRVSFARSREDLFPHKKCIAKT